MVRTDGRAYGHVITKFSRMGRLPHFLSYGAPSTRALRARVELRYYVTNGNWTEWSANWSEITIHNFRKKGNTRSSITPLLHNFEFAKFSQYHTVKTRI